ncbi:MAG: hypothetical protein LW629_04280 [Burkholderiales bacterium]|nr:hypothetical protein [Burkholderiales bacterium]
MGGVFNFKSVFLFCLIVLGIQAAGAADLANGEKLHTDKCVACHAQKAVFGEPDIFYLKKDRKVNDFNGVKRMVSLCNTELRLDLFPEDEQDIALFLNTRYYRFK